jgi:hypothetical protein
MKREGPFLLSLLLAFSLAAQQPPTQTPPHDIDSVDVAPSDGAISTPLPQREQRRLKKYDLPELAGSRQALGPQLIDGRLPKPLVDYVEISGELHQRISIFEGGLVVVDLNAPSSASIHKRLLIPNEALAKYLEAASTKRLDGIRQDTLRLPVVLRRATLRVYGNGTGDGASHFVERAFDPIAALPKPLTDAVIPLQDLMRAICEDRTVTNSVSNYIPHVGDELVGDDRNIYRVERIASDQGVIELKCLTNPTRIFVKQSELANYFIGKPAVKKN